jgi:steroid delta-isomerase-like uncharacterized protein
LDALAPPTSQDASPQIAADLGPGDRNRRLDARHRPRHRHTRTGKSFAAAAPQETLMSIESTRAVMTRYLDSNHSDVSMIADDAVYTIMATGEEHRGPDGIAKLLDYFYRVAFDAGADVTNVVIADGKAMMEAEFHGLHIGEFAGVPATNKSVRVPLCVVYDLENDKIKRGRVYFEIPVFLKQVGAIG